jgi:hypothetical protein
MAGLEKRSLPFYTADISLGRNKTGGITECGSDSWYIDENDSQRCPGGVSIALFDISDMRSFKKNVKVVFVSYGSCENGAAAKTNVEALQKQERLLRIARHTARLGDLAAKLDSVRSVAVPE